ncbi:centrosomal protein of 95 kDa-like [Chiloscyllium plagiosum]|uniref:centrosomal protein of 95 kDa-like n=1 Tax=Chiloscyllium plagiosum TaxID=36176 RepID=UPI001CB80E98|nr:centrosomal protein of 95 kDa-like [Chiloscyllium plagiosum]
MEAQDERDWITIANNLLHKCHINQRVTKLCECDAGVFIALYEAILGEKVPDYIATPKSQEDDVHNVQAVIDSLALDYLQISLSHITGENIIQSDQENIRNLLEIFDGLLEYLTEQISDASSQHDDPDLLSNEAISVIRSVLQEEFRDSYKETVPDAGAHSSKASSSSATTWNGAGSESTNELIRLGESACTYSHRKNADLSEYYQIVKQSEQKLEILDQGQNGFCCFPLGSAPVPDTNGEKMMKPGRSVDNLPSKDHSTGLITNALQLGEPIRPAIPLQSPYHPPEYGPPVQGAQLIGYQSISDTTLVASEKDQSAIQTGELKVKRVTPVHNVPDVHENIPSKMTPSRLSPDSIKVLVPQESQSAGRGTKKDQELQNTAQTTVANSDNVQKRVAFQTQPDIRLMTMQSKMDQWDSVLEEHGESNHWQSSATLERNQHNFRNEDSSLSLNHRDRGDICTLLGDEPLSRRRVKNILAEEELHEMSEQLSLKLRQLDMMLKQALGEKDEVHNSKEEDKLSQHSDSITEYRRVQQLPAKQTRKPARARSLSPSPPRHTLQAEFEDAVNKDSKGQMRRIRRELQKEMDQQRMKAKEVSESYKEELVNYKMKEKSKLEKEKKSVKKAEQEYKENIFKETPKTPQPAKVYSANTTPRKQKHSQWTRAGVTKPKKATPMKIQDNDLLPLLLEEFPYLPLSPHAMNRMWKQQFKQIEQLIKSGLDGDRSQAKLQSAIEDAQKKHDLLINIIKKEQDHNLRLKEFKERIRQQKAAQNKMKEQRQQIARAKKYYNDYHVQLHAKMMRARTREERIFKNLFEEGLEIQKQRLRELKTYTKEKRQEYKKQQKEELQSMENYYRDQFLMLAETLAQEQQKINVQETAQNKALQKWKKELRAKMEKEIRELQEMIIQDDDDVFFRELEAERIQQQLQMASFQYSKIPL